MIYIPYKSKKKNTSNNKIVTKHFSSVKNYDYQLGQVLKVPYKPFDTSNVDIDTFCSSILFPDIETLSL